MKAIIIGEIVVIITTLFAVAYTIASVSPDMWPLTPFFIFPYEGIVMLGPELSLAVYFTAGFILGYDEWWDLAKGDLNQ